MHIRRATLEDTADMAMLSSNAMMDDELFEWLCPWRRERTYDFRLGFLRRTRKRILRGGDVFVMVTDKEDPEWGGKERLTGLISIVDHKEGAMTPSLWYRE
jgi:hypothetical protein